ncbi:transcriptional regulator, TetR family [Cohaesibacter sp. ES.047]|uniref:CerR family C-terminal domain-containing protein n=1 Tax=Cohaesibacter sp. ES.047 TaxID=1798205 RepID=UPI000BB87AD0|nr:CerR family C-terminal domain-containing protein [Cohaesibacter sp. ES.047]SNY91562.1 transcriptional regulator, TetR family [Cohaesibacter sp. ES.047]
MARQTRSEATRTALIDAAFELFGDKGYAAASTREIASAAGTNIASITYHFGGKAGLRMACAETIVSHMLAQRKAPDQIATPRIAQNAETEFELFMLRQANMLLSLNKAQTMVRFLFRELYEQTEVFEHMYQRFFGPVFDHVSTLWAKAIDIDPEEAQSNENKIRIFSVIAQIAYFRIGQPVVVRHLGWADYDTDETEQILRVLQTNIRALIAAYRTTSSHRTTQ